MLTMQLLQWVNVIMEQMFEPNTQPYIDFVNPLLQNGES